MTSEQAQKEFHDVVEKASNDFHMKVHDLTKEQLAEALAQAVLCGDFTMLIEKPEMESYPPGTTKVEIKQRQAVTYVPYRRMLDIEQKLEQALEDLRKATEEIESAGYVTCPFCHETDFDKVGLKFHYTAGHCDVFNNTKGVHETS